MCDRLRRMVCFASGLSFHKAVSSGEVQSCSNTIGGCSLHTPYKTDTASTFQDKVRCILALKSISIREGLLLITIAALCMPYVVDIGRKWNRPKFPEISGSTLLAWIQEHDPSATLDFNEEGGSATYHQSRVTIDSTLYRHDNGKILEQAIPETLKESGWTLNSSGTGPLGKQWEFSCRGARWRVYLMTGRAIGNSELALKETAATFVLIRIRESE